MSVSETGRGEKSGGNEMAHAFAAQYLAVEIDENEILVEDFLEADVAALQPQSATPRIAVGEVAERHVVVALEIEDAMGPRDVEQRPADLVVLHHAGLVAGLAEKRRLLVAADARDRHVEVL